MRRIVLALLLCSSFAYPGAAQSLTGKIFGTVSDPASGSVPGAEVTVTNVGTNRAFTVTSEENGNYAVSELGRGEYAVEVSAEGFKKAVRRGIVLELQQQAKVDLILELGTLTETVEVVADADLLETSDATLGKVVDNRRILSLPLNTRNVFSLLYLTPGVTGGVSTTYGSGYGINGARNSMLDIVVDGVSTAHPTVNGFSGNSTFPPVDAIAEFKVIGSNYSADFGRSLGGITNVVYKSGTNELHGSAFEFLRNSKLDANNFFDNRVGRDLGTFQRNQFGGHVTGPVVRNKLFFMGSYEGLRERSFATSTFTVPTALERAGDFSETRVSNGSLVQMFDPFTTRQLDDGSFVRDAFAGNQIPGSRVDAVARNVAEYYPESNIAGEAVTNQNNYSNSGSRQFDTDQFDTRIDSNLTSAQRIFGRFAWRETSDAPPAYFPSNLTIAEGRVTQGVRQPSAAFEYSNTLSPSTIFTGRLGFSRSLFTYNNHGLGFQPSSLGLPQSIDKVVDREMFPRFGASGYVNLGGNDHRSSSFMTYSAMSALSKQMGDHSMKLGWEGRMIRVNVWEARSAGTFNFSRNFTQGPNPTRASSTAGNSIASLLLGTGTENNVLIQAWKNVAAQSFYHAFYFQDDWRLTPKLTLNLGVRYDFDLPRTERYNRMNWFDPDATSPLAGQVEGYPNIRGGLRFVGVDGNPRSQFNKDLNNLAPRFGLAYQANRKTVVRMGYGHFYGPSRQAAQGTVGPFGFRVEYPWLATLDGVTPFHTLSDPYPDGFRTPPGSSEGLLTQAGANLQAFVQDSPAPWMMQWNFSIQRELPGKILLETAYVGNRGLQLNRSTESGMELNQLDPKYLSMGSQLNELVDNPFFGVVNNGIHLQPVVRRGQLLRQYPQFTNVVPLYDAGASSTYHAWQNTFKRRFFGGLQFEGSYTWARILETGTSHQDTFNVAASRALAGQDIAHRAVASVLYELPFGKGRAIGGNLRGPLNWIVGGWQVNAIVTGQSGTPLSISANNTAGIFNSLTLPNNNGQSGRLNGKPQDRLGAWFDTGVFSQPAPFTFGNHARYSPDIRRDSIQNWDLSLFKEIAITERLRSQFRAEFFNALNHPTFGSPNTSVTSSAFGVVASQDNDPRQVQFGLKFLW